MLERLVIRNFQCHHKFALELDQVVCVTGASDSGKSSILRALRWACLNRPQGDSFISHGQKYTAVKLKVDGHAITRKRGVANTYSLDGSKYKAFGNDVPSDIEKLLNLDSTNFQCQLDGANKLSSPQFWFALSPGEVSKELNAVIALDRIDSTLANIASMLRKAKSNVELTQERLSEAKQTVELLDWVPVAEKELKQIEDVGNRLEAVKARRNELQTVLDAIITKERELERLGGIDEQSEALAAMDVVWAKIKEKRGFVKDLAEVLTEIRDKKMALGRAEEMQIQAEQRFRTESKGKCPVCGSAFKPIN